jgi:hypothetical protein
MLGRWAAWLGNAMDYDGFRIDAGKHVVREFFGDPNTGFLHEAQYNFAQRRGIPFDPANFDQYKNDLRRKQMLNFSEIFTGSNSTFDYWRQGNVKMRYLDFPLKQSVIGNAFSNGNLGSLGTIGAGLDPTEGVMFVQSHDQDAPGKLELGYAYLLTHIGLPIVYFSGNNISWSDYNTKTWVKPGIGSALGDYNGTITNLVYISNQFARGREWNRWNENSFFCYERYDDLNNNASPDSGEALLLVALNATGSDQTRTVATSFPNGTVLHDYTGNNVTDVTVANAQATIKVPARGGQGFVCYAPYTATALGTPVRFLQNGSPVGTMNWVVPGGRDAAAKSRTIPRITGNSVDIEVDYTDPVGGSVDSVIVRWGQGRNVNSAATFFGGQDIVASGYQQATYVGPAGKWNLTADLTNVPEGLHLIKARAFTHRAAGLPAVFQTFSKVVYVDRSGPSLNISLPDTLNGDAVAIISNSDKTAGKMEARIDGGSWQDVSLVMRGTWKFSVTGLTAGAHALEVRAHEYDNAATKTEINLSTATKNFTVAAGGPNIAMNWTQGQTITQPFPLTTITVDAGVATSAVHMWWDGYEQVGLTGTATITHTFDGRFTSGAVEQRLYGAFTNGPHFFEAEVTVNGLTKRVCRTVVFNLYGQNMADSDGDGIPDDIEIPGTLAGLNPNTPLPGDSNQDTIPNDGEHWTKTNPLNQDTNYDGKWDGDEDSDGDGVPNLEEVRQGFLQFGDAYHFNIYDAASKPAVSTQPQATWTLSSSAGQTHLVIDYRPNNGALASTSPIYVRIVLDGGVAQTFAMTNMGGGLWEYNYNVPSGGHSATLSFQNQTGSISDSNGSYANVNVYLAPHVFTMDGQFDSANYEVANSGMKILAALKGTKFYVATWSPKGGANDHFIFVTDQFGNSEAHPWNKANQATNKIFFSKSTKPWLAGESTTTAGSNYNSFTNGGASNLSTMGAGGQALEGEIDLMETFGYVPQVLYLSAVAYGTNDGNGINSQCPAPWSADNNLQITEFQPVATESIRDENLDGYFDKGRPALETVVNGNTADANYGLRRFFLNELMKDTGQVTVNLYPNVAPGALVTNVEVVTNINRRNFASLDDNFDQATATSQTYYRSYAMTSNGSGGYTVTLPVTRCGVYRITARYRVNGSPWIYYTDHAQRRDCAIVVSPKKAQTATMYEVNPMIVEATGTTQATRSTFRDLYTANVDRPDIINNAHFTGLGVNMIWLQPMHPIGDPSATGSAFVPGSPYSVRDYWSVNPLLGADNTSIGATNEFQTFVQQMDGIGVNVMMDATFNHCAPDAVIGQGAMDLFPAWATDPNIKIRDVRPQWFSKAGDYGTSATNANELALAPDRTDFGKWPDVRDFYFGNYDALVKTAGDAEQDDYLLERDDFAGFTPTTRELWQYFAYYPIYWLTKTGCPPGTPPEQSFKGIDGLRCDFAQGMPSKFWEYCINKTRSVKWDFLFMAESLDGFRTVNGSNRHGVGYRSARQFDILNENIVFYWRDQFFAYPANGAGSAGTANPTTFPTFKAYDDRRNAYDNVVLLNNLTSHDEVFPSNDPYAILQGYAEVSALDGIPMMMYGQEAGARNDATTYGFSGVANANNNWDLYELNFGKSIPNFKTFNSMHKVWQNRDFNLQSLYSRINTARKNSPALRSQNVYFLARTDTGTYDPDMFAVAKFQEPGVSAAWQDVVFAFVNNNYAASSTRWATYNLNAVVTGGANRFGIVAGHTYNLVDLAAANTSAHVWSTDRTATDIISTGITVGLTTAATTGGQVQYLKLIDTSESHAGQPNPYVNPSTANDGIPDSWKQTYGLSITDANLANRDSDGDGLTTYQEYLAGTDPTNAASKLTLNGVEKNATGIDITWSSVPGMDYRVRYSDDLQSWSDFQNVPMAITADSNQTVLSISVPFDAVPKTFFRVELLR